MAHRDRPRRVDTADLFRHQSRGEDPSLSGTALAAIGWTMIAVVILTAILVACCAPFALTFMFFRKVVGA